MKRIAGGVAALVLLGACSGGGAAESDTTEPPRCGELRSEFEGTVDGLGGVELAMGTFEEGSERATLLEVGVVATYTSPSDPPIEFLLEVDTEFAFELATGKIYVATFEEVYDLYADLLDEGCDLGWFADLTQPYRETASGNDRVIEPLPEW